MSTTIDDTLAESTVILLDAATDVCGWLDEVFAVIRDEASKASPNTIKIRRLADMGAYVGMDFANYFDVQREGLVDATKGDTVTA